MTTSRLRLLSSIVLVFGFLIAACSKKELILSYPPANAVLVDGESTEWTDSLTFYDPEVGLRYGFQNDNEHLYVLVETQKRENIAKIMSLGLTVWANNKGKAKTQTGVKYPIGMMNEQRDAPGGFGGGSGLGRGQDGNPGERPAFEEGNDEYGGRFERMLENMELHLSQLELWNFPNYPGDLRLHKSELRNGVKAEIKLTRDGVFTYELGLPIALLFDPDDKKANRDNLTFGIGFETGKLERPSRNSGGGPGGGFGGGGRGGGGGFGGGGRPGGGRGGFGSNGGGQSPGGPDFEALAERIKLWKRVRVSR